MKSEHMWAKNFLEDVDRLIDNVLLHKWNCKGELKNSLDQLYKIKFGLEGAQKGQGSDESVRIPLLRKLEEVANDFSDVICQQKAKVENQTMDQVQQMLDKIVNDIAALHL